MSFNADEASVSVKEVKGYLKHVCQQSYFLDGKDDQKH